MRQLSTAQKVHILHFLNKGESATSIASKTGVSLGSVSKIHHEHCPDLAKSVGGCPSKLSPANIQYAAQLIISQKADNATQVTQSLQNIVSTPLSVKTVRRALRKGGMRPVVKCKQPLLTKKYKEKRRHWAEEHMEWTLEDWKRIVWSDETKINCLGSNGREWT